MMGTLLTVKLPGLMSEFAMPRLPRLQYENAIYHIVTRGDGRRRLFHDQGHYERKVSRVSGANGTVDF
jgi:hypothetical protein